MPSVEQHPSPSSSRWSTYPNCRTVLAVVHNTTAATRLFDTIEILAPDPRIRIIFTRTGSSVFDTDTSEFINTRGAIEIPWHAAVSQSFDLAVSASYGGSLHEIQAPLLVVPHGMGYNKYLNKEQRTKNKEQRTKNKEQRTKNKEQRTKNKEQRTKNKASSAYHPIGFCTMDASSPRSSSYPMPNNATAYNRLALKPFPVRS
ncbi:hypothetical protein ACQPW1_29805 [Nocardia sp. CA-128927]|uniref:hypothetical protein n=1 Tax=Nocardia sp. CA-128927 TaxID=3239975 RepID=UPI003D95EBD2